MRQKILLVSAAAFILSLVTACSFLNPPFPALDTGLIYTSAAKTFAVEHPSQTPQPAVTITPTLFPSATATPIIPPAVISTATLTNTPSYSDSCYYDSVVTDENIPDGTEIYTGESFEKTWEFYNSGTCNWNEDFSLVFIHGRRLGGTTVYLDNNVKPGKYIEVTVDLTAPSSEGEYVGYWQLLDGNGILFGDKPYIDIEVIIKPTATQTRTMTKTMTRTSTPSPTATRTRTPTLTSTYTASPTSTLTSSPTATSTLTPTETETPSSSPTSTNTLPPSDTPTPTNTFTPTSTMTPRPPVGYGTYDDRSTNVVYTGSWVAQKISGNYLNTEKYSNLIGSSASFTFTGEIVRVIYRGYPSILGNMEVRIDGVYVTAINQNTTVQQKQLKWTSGNLGAGTHTLTLTHLTGTYVTLDGIIVSGSPTATPTITPSPT